MSQSDGISLESIFQVDQGIKRVYLIQNSKVITQIFQNKQTTEILNSLDQMLAEV